MLLHICMYYYMGWDYIVEVCNALRIYCIHVLKHLMLEQSKLSSYGIYFTNHAKNGEHGTRSCRNLCETSILDSCKR